MLNIPLNDLPSDLEAEQSLLGAIILNNELYDIVRENLQSDYFFHAFHIKIYKAIEEIAKQSLPISASTITGILCEDKDFILNDGREYLSHLVSLGITVYQPKSYASIIHNFFLKRQLISIGASLIQEAKSPDATQSAIKQIESVETKLFNLAHSKNNTSHFDKFSKLLTSSIQAVDTARKNPQHVTGISSGFIDLDKKLSGFQNSDLIILAARPSMGKTALALNLAMHIAKNLKKAVGFFSLEMSSSQLATRLLATETKLNSSLLKNGKISEEQYNILREKEKSITDLNLFIDDTPAVTIHALARKAKRLKRTQNIDILFVDYLQLIRGTNSDNRVAEISEITQGLKALAKELDIPIVTLSQLSRAVEIRQDKRPMLSDLRDSGTIEQDADIVMFIYREEYYLSRSEPNSNSSSYDMWHKQLEQAANRAELLIAKHRNGPIGTVNLHYDSNITQFNNLGT